MGEFLPLVPWKIKQPIVRMMEVGNGAFPAAKPDIPIRPARVFVLPPA